MSFKAPKDIAGFKSDFIKRINEVFQKPALLEETMNKAIYDKALLSALREPLFNQHWQAQLAHYNLKAHKKYRACDQIFAAFLVRRATEKEVYNQDLLQAAMLLGSFQAIRHLQNILYQKIFNGKYTASKPDDVMLALYALAEKAAKVHGMPGVLLLAETHYYLGQYAAQMGRDSDARLHYVHVAEHLYYAEYLEEKCGIEIFNAYLGKSLPEAVNNDLALSYRRIQFESWTKFRETCLGAMFNLKDPIDAYVLSRKFSSNAITKLIAKKIYECTAQDMEHSTPTLRANTI